MWCAISSDFLWKKPSMAFFHEVVRRKRRGFPGSTGIASSDAAVEKAIHGHLDKTSPSVAHRLRDGKSLVASAPRAFADPSASVTRWSKASPDAMPVGQGNPWRFSRPTSVDKGHGWLCPRILKTAKVSSLTLLERSPIPPPPSLAVFGSQRWFRHLGRSRSVLLKGSLTPSPPARYTAGAQGSPARKETAHAPGHDCLVSSRPAAR